jgi:hypothetical protein
MAEPELFLSTRSRAMTRVGFTHVHRLDQRIYSCFRHQHMLAIDHQHHKYFLIKRQQPSRLRLGLSLSIGVAQQIQPL